MSALLVITTGRTDVQLVDGDARRELSPGNCASLHDEIERRTGEWRLVDSPPTKVVGEIKSFPESSFDLCTPKLDAVLRYAQDNQIQLTSALILETRRALVGDPRYAGTVLAARLQQRGCADVLRVSFLVGEELLEDKPDPRDSIIRREVVDRVDSAIRDSFEALKPKQVVVATTGGFPAVERLVEEVVRLYAVPKVEVKALEVADGAKARPPSEDRAVPRAAEPAASYQARWHALDLIEKGNLLGAWGAVQHLHSDPGERRWTEVLEWLRIFAASLPIPDSCDIGVLKHERLAIKTALRVELALRAGDIPRAVHGTVAFFESALWDHLRPRLTRHHEKRRLYKVDPAPADNLIRKEDGSAEDRKRPFEVTEESDGARWYRIYDDDVCGIRLAKHYLQQEALQNFGQAVSKVRELRNDVAHNEPTSALMNEAHDKMVAASLWSPSREFLAMPLVQGVLRELGEQHPDRLCTDLVSTVRSRLLNRSPFRAGRDDPIAATVGMASDPFPSEQPAVRQ